MRRNKIFLIIFLVGCGIAMYSQGILNNGATIKVNGNPTIYINNGNYIVQNKTVDDEVGGLVVFHAESGVEQKIKGDNIKIVFSELKLENEVKTLETKVVQVDSKLGIDGAVLNLNKNKIIINNGLTGAIDVVNGGYIKSETKDVDGLGEVQWNIGNNADEYVIPFGSGNSSMADLELKFKTKSVDNANGRVTFATYPTDVDNNDFPTGTKPHNNPKKVADRYWEIYPEGYNSIKYDITVNYASVDISQPNTIKPDKLNLFSYDGSKWKKNKSVVSGNSVLLSDYTEKYKYWTLSDAGGKLYIPNIITPDGDGKNDLFGIARPEDDTKYSDRKDLGIEEEISTVKAKIFNRWGRVVENWTGGNEETPYNGGVFIGGTWDGKKGTKELSEGTYFYTFDVVDDAGKSYKFQGTVNVIKK